MGNRKIALEAGPLSGTEWTLVKRFREGRVTFWRCVCSCGSTWDVPEGNLKSGKSTKCGCHQSRVYASEKVNAHSASSVFRNARDRFGSTSWTGLAHFVEDCYRHKTPQTFLRKLNEDAPIGPGNWEWRSRIKDRRSAEARDTLAAILRDPARVKGMSNQRVYFLLRVYDLRVLMGLPLKTPGKVVLREARKRGVLLKYRLDLDRVRRSIQ